MNYVQTEPPTQSNWQTSLIFALLLQALLLGGLYYLNSENPSTILPTSIVDWLETNKEITFVDQ